MADFPAIEAGLFTVRQTSLPEEELEEFVTYRAGRVLNMAAPPVLCSVGLMGNLMTLLVLTRSAFPSNACCHYLVALALCDVTVLLLIFCFGFVDVFLYTLLSTNLACKLYHFIVFTCGHLSAWLLVAVTAQRCFVVCCPMTSITVTSKRCTVFVIGGLTVASVVLNSHHLFIRQIVWNDLKKNYGCHTRGTAREEFVRNIWPWIHATVYCFFPSVCLIIFNTLIVRALRKAAVFRKRHQRRRQQTSRQARHLFVVRDSLKTQCTEDDEDFSPQGCAKSSFLCEIGEASSTSRVPVTARQSSIQSTDNPERVSESEDTCLPFHSINKSQLGSTAVATHMLKTEVKVEMSGGGDRLPDDSVMAKPSAPPPICLLEKESLTPGPDSAGIFSIETCTDDQSVNRESTATSFINTLSVPLSESGERSDRSKALDHHHLTTLSKNDSVTDPASNKQNEEESRSENSDVATKFTKRSILRLFFIKRKQYKVKSRTSKLIHMERKCENDTNVMNTSLIMSRALDVQNNIPTTNERMLLRSQSHAQENPSRQLTLMPLLASLMFVTLSAPLAVMIVAEHMVWVRNTPEQFPMADFPAIEAGLFTVRQTSLPEEELEEFVTYRAGRVLNMAAPPVLCSVGLMGNLMTLLVLTCSAFPSNACCHYLVALALCDVTVLLLIFCFGFVDVFLYTLLSTDLACKLYYFVFFTCAHLSSWLLVAVTAQRCFVVCCPMTSITVTSKRCTVFVIGGMTVASVVLNSHHLFIRQIVWNDLKKNYGCHTRGTVREEFVHNIWPWIDATVYCFFPSVCLIIFNTLIVRALRKAAVFRKRHQRRRQKASRQTRHHLFVVRDSLKTQCAEDDEDFSPQGSAKSSFMCEIGEASSISRVPVTGRQSSIQSTDNPERVSESEDTCPPFHSINKSQMGSTAVATHMLKTEVKVEMSGGGDRLPDDSVMAKPSAPSPICLSENESLTPGPDSAGIFSIETSTDDQSVNRESTASSFINTLSVLLSESGEGSDKSKALDHHHLTTLSKNDSVTDPVSNKQKEQGSRSENSDLATKFTERSILRLFFIKRKQYKVKSRTSKLIHMERKCENDTNVMSTSLVMSRALDVQKNIPTTNERMLLRSQSHAQENPSRQLTLMPLLASLMFVTLSAPLAVMIVAEHTVWVRNSPEQVAVYTLVRIVVNTLMCLNHALNFLLYCFAGSTFRHHCWLLLCRICPCLSSLCRGCCPGPQSSA